MRLTRTLFFLGIMYLISLVSRFWQERLDYQVSQYEYVIQKDFQKSIDEIQALISEVRYRVKRDKTTAELYGPLFNDISFIVERLDFNEEPQARDKQIEYFRRNYQNILQPNQYFNLLDFYTKVLLGLLENIEGIDKLKSNKNYAIIINSIGQLNSDTTLIKMNFIDVFQGPSKELWIQNDKINLSSLSSKTYNFLNPVTGGQTPIRIVKRYD